MNARHLRPLCPSARPHGLLSRGEARVLAFSAAGYSRDETARLLQVGAETVKSQRESVLRKLRARNTAHGVAVAFVRGYLDADLLARAAAYEGADDWHKRGRVPQSSDPDRLSARAKSMTGRTRARVEFS